MDMVRLLRQRLSPPQLRGIERALKRGPEAIGYATGLWTSGRVRDLIEQRTGGALPRGPRLALPAQAGLEREVVPSA